MTPEAKAAIDAQAFKWCGLCVFGGRKPRDQCHCGNCRAFVMFTKALGEAYAMGQADEAAGRRGAGRLCGNCGWPEAIHDGCGDSGTVVCCQHVCDKFTPRRFHGTGDNQKREQ